MPQIFTAFVFTSAIGTVLALILALLRPVTRKVFSGSWHYYMWLAVLLVMVLPIRLNLPQKPAATPPASETITAADIQAENTRAPIIIEAQPEQIVQMQASQPEKPSKVQAAKDFLNSKILFLSFIWLLGVALLFAIKITGYIVFLIKIRRHSSAISCPEIKSYTQRKIKTRVSDSICSPLVIGMISPTLILPKADITPEQLHNVLAHEMTHLKRNDVLYKWFAGIVKCIHWFNPAIYFICKQINIDCEISCDLAVTKDMDEQSKKDYVETILSLLTHNNSKAIPLTTGMAGDKKTLKKRFSMIKNKINISKKAAIVSIILAVILCIGAIFVSGIINGRFNTSDTMLIDVTTDKREGNEFNFLMIGTDNNQKIDTIIVFNFDGNTLTCMNIPRNVTLAISEDVPDYNKSLSHLLSEENGDQKVIDAIKETLGIPVHYYAKVKMAAIADVVDYVDGIEFDVPYNMTYDDPAQDLHIDLKAGKQVLNGKQVEHLLRFRDRQHPNDEEIRTMTCHSVIKEFLNQAVIGNKVGNLSELYKIATKNIKTNYSLKDFKKDFGNLKNINRNNIVTKNIKGRNAVLNGYFAFHINYVESKPLLEVFNSSVEGKKLISAVTYTNDDLGFSIKVPERWKSKYEAIQFDTQVAFMHKDIFLKYGKGSGNLFTITKMKQPSEKILEESGVPYEYLYSGKEYAYVWSVASDVQYPTWQDRDEEDVRFAEDFEDMMKDLDFIKNSFSLIDEEDLLAPADQLSKTNTSANKATAITYKEQGSDTINSFIWPSESTTVTNSFGKRVHPVTGEEKTHNGIDISAPENSPVVSATYGKVTDTGFDSNFGNYVIIENDNGVKSYYGHLSEVDVKKGDNVSGNTVIGKVGKSGTATGPNLHFEIQINGEYKDPEQIFSPTTKKVSSVTNKTTNADKTTNKNDIKVKATTSSDNSDIQLSHLTLKPDINIATIEQSLKQSGITVSKDNNVDLSKNYILGKCQSGDNIETNCDNNGNITLYFNANENDYIDIIFTDNQTGKVVAEYGVMPDISKSYSFMGFEKGKEYDIVLQEHIKNDINYIVY